MTEKSRLTDAKLDAVAAKEVIGQANLTDHDSAEDADSPDSKDPDSRAAGAAADKKKKSKKAKLKKALGVGGKQDGDQPGSSSHPAGKLTDGMVEQLLEINPSLKSEVAGLDIEKTAESVKKMDVADLLTGMVCLERR